MEISGGKLVAKVTWASSADLDLQALQFANTGAVLDAVYWGNPRSDDASTVHTSGDAGGNAAAVNAEEIVIDLDAVSPCATTIAFVVSSYDTSLPVEAVQAVMLSVEHQPSAATAASGDAYHAALFPAACDGCLVVAAFALERVGKRDFRVNELSASLPGTTFVDAVPALREHYRLATPPPGSPEFAIPIRLRKGEFADLGAAASSSKGSSSKRRRQRQQSVDVADPHTLATAAAASGVVVAGCGWDVAKGGADAADVDLSALVFGRDEEIVERVFWGRLSAFDGAIEHAGDNASGEDSDGRVGGDDETIRVDLHRLPPSVQSVCFVVNNYGNGSLAAVRNVHFRLFVPGRRGAFDEQSLVHVSDLGAGGDHSGFALAVLCRSPDAAGGWRVVALDDPVDGDSILSPRVAEAAVGIVRNAIANVATPANLRNALGARRSGERKSAGSRRSAAEKQRFSDPLEKKKRHDYDRAGQQQQAVAGGTSYVTAVAVALLAAVVLKMLMG